MKNMFRKLNFKRGASITLALLIFLLCALAGVTALTMAMANIGRFSHAQDDQQPYYTVSSAALLMVDLLDGTEYTSPLVEYDSIREWEHVNEGGMSSHPSREYNTLNLLNMDALYDDSLVGTAKGSYYLKDKAAWNTNESDKSSIAIYLCDKNGDYILKENEEGEKVVKQTVSNALTDTSTSNSLKLLTKLKDYCDDLVPYSVVPQEWYDTVKFTNKTVTPSQEVDAGLKVDDFLPAPLDYAFTISAESLSTVSARLVMQDNYNLLLSFSCRESIGSGTDKQEYAFYAVNVYWTATVTTTTHSDPTEFEYVTDGDKGKMISKQTKRVTVRWNKSNVTISRGEAASQDVVTPPSGSGETGGQDETQG